MGFKFTKYKFYTHRIVSLIGYAISEKSKSTFKCSPCKLIYLSPFLVWHPDLFNISLTFVHAQLTFKYSLKKTEDLPFFRLIIGSLFIVNKQTHLFLPISVQVHATL